MTLTRSMQSFLSYLLLHTFIVGITGLTPNIAVQLSPQNRPEVSFDDVNISEACLSELNNLILNKNTYGETERALDAFGKPASGFLVGNFAWIGHYDECMNLTQYRYCLASFPIQESLFNSSFPISFTLGMCTPRNCSETDLVSGIHLIEELIPPITKVVQPAVSMKLPACTEYPHVPYSAGFYFTVILFSLWTLLVLGSTLYQVYLNYVENPTQTDNVRVDQPSPQDDAQIQNSHDDKTHLIGSAENSYVIQVHQKPERSTMQKVLLSFSLLTNLPKLLAPANTTSGSIGCLNGIRVLSMCWVILGHVFIFRLMFAPIMNPLTALGWFDRLGFMVVVNGFFSVDSFFYMSGLLVCYVTLNQMDKTNGRLNWGWFYFHRYWRLTPALAAATLLYMFIMPYLGDGPFAQSLSARPSCSKYWWTNFLYINNFYPVENGQACIAWFWYLANDMQFFIISPIIIYALYKLPVLGYSFICSLLLGSFATIATLMIKYDLQSRMSFTEPGHATGNFESLIYVKPYCRISPYLVGLAMGYFLNKNKTLKWRLPVVFFIVGWIVALALGFTIVYGVYTTYHDAPWTLAESTVYQMFASFGWGIFLSWVVFACHYGYGGWINTFLSWDFWAPLGRLTYSCYLLHPMVIMLVTANQATASYLSLMLTGFYFTGVTTLGYAAGGVLSLCLEFPLVGLEKLFIPRPSK